jgi:hypothetical protein
MFRYADFLVVLDFKFRLLGVGINVVSLALVDLLLGSPSAQLLWPSTVPGWALLEMAFNYPGRSSRSERLTHDLLY